MRRLGSVILIGGIVLEVLLVMAMLGGGDSVSRVHLSYGFYLIVLGWQLKKHGSGLKPEKQGPHSISGEVPQEQESPSREIPLTAEMAELIQRRMQRQQKARRTALPIIFLFSLLLGVAISFAVGPSDARVIMLWSGGIGMLVTGIIGAAMIFGDDRKLRRDFLEPNYLRTVGPVQIVKSKFGYILRLSDRALFIDGRQARSIRHLDWATIDYSRHAKLIFAVWDRSGKLVYQLAGSRP